MINDALNKTVHKIIHGDALKVLKTIGDNSIDLIFSDPPYNMSKTNGLKWSYSSHVTMHEPWDIFDKDEFFNFNREWIGECVRTLKPGGSFWISGTFHNIFDIGFIIKNIFNLKINNTIVWYKPNAQPNITCRFFTESTEYLLWASKNDSKHKWKFNYGISKSDIYDNINPKNKQTRNVWEIPLTPKKEKIYGNHPSQKPLELLRRIIISTSDEYDTVLDPFAGSGTTAVSCIENNRNSIGIENNDEYINIIKNRINGKANGSIIVNYENYGDEQNGLQ